LKNRQRTIIHIGLPRAASTFFQRHIFPQIAGFKAFGPAITEYHPSFTHLLYADDSAYDPALIQAWKSEQGDQSMLLSNELFCGRSHLQASANRAAVASRLKQHWPESEIVLFLRNQVDLLQSLYAIDTYAGMRAKPEQYLHFGSSPPADDSAYEWAGSWNYQALISLYRSHFDNVRVYLFEDFVADRDSFLADFKRDLDIEVSASRTASSGNNASLGASQIRALQRLNRFKSFVEKSKFGESLFRKVVQQIEHRWPGGARFEFSNELKQRIADHFRESNQQLASKLGAGISANFDRFYLKP